MLNIHLHRHRISDNACDGTISISGTRICDTAEHSQHRPSVGTYRLQLRHSKQHGRKVPVLAEAPNACLVHGNGIYGSSDGRILLGIRIAPGCVRHSYPHFKLLYDRINAALRRGHEVKLIITED